VFLIYFDVLISKIIFLNKKIYYFNIFSSEKYFEKQLSPHSQTPPKHEKKKTKKEPFLTWKIKE
jgi:hypothetical protein